MAGIDTPADSGSLAGPPSRGGSFGGVTEPGGGDATLAGDGPSLRVEDEAIGQGAVIGRYVVLGRLGAGGMGVVHAAYDPELDRKVAIKLLLGAPGGSLGTDARTRLMREAQALAKLSHPNVVAVYDVGTVGDRVWMAMELVKGQTLAAWITERRRPWRDVVRIMTAAGEGLWAAHEEGILHRDFKPDNVMLDASDRVRVMDFGLALAGPDAPVRRTVSGLAEPVGPGSLSLRVTGAGALMGTPGYMPPEQIGAEPLDARADQFAFAVSLWQALYGRKPFPGHSVPEVITRVLSGDVERPPAGVRVPGWLRRVCERGMARDPAQRFPSMRALLDALARGQARARQRVGLGIAGVVLAVGAGALGLRRWDEARQRAACAAEGASIEAVWNDDARSRVRASLIATGVSHAQTTADKVLPWIDREVDGWSEHRTRACEQATVDGRWDPDTLDRARWCLDDRRLVLESLVRVLSEADRGVVQRAVATVASLEPSAACLDEDVLARAPDPPAAADRPRIVEVRQQLSRAAALQRVGKPAEGLALVEGLRDEVAAIDWPPLSARAAALEGYLLQGTGELARAEEVTSAAYMQAAAASDWGEAADVASQLAHLVGYVLARPAEGRRWAEHAAMAASFVPDPLGLREAKRLTERANIELGVGAYAEAGALYEQALALRRAALGPEHFTVARLLVNLGVVAWSQGHAAAAKRAYEEALPLLTDVLGPDHPDLSLVLGNLAAVAYGAGDYAEAKRLYERAYAIDSASLPPGHPNLAAALDNLALVTNALGQPDEAFALAQRALAIWTTAVGPRHPSLALSYYNLASIERARGRATQMRAAYEQAVAIYRQAEGQQQYEPEAEFELAKLLLAAGERARALELAGLALEGLRAAGDGKANDAAEVEAWLADASPKPP